MLFQKSWFNKTILFFYIHDILNAGEDFLTYEEFQNKFSIRTNYEKEARSVEVSSHEQLQYSATIVSLFPELSTPVDLANINKTLNKNSTVAPNGIKTLLFILL